MNYLTSNVLRSSGRRSAKSRGACRFLPLCHRLTDRVMQSVQVLAKPVVSNGDKASMRRCSSTTCNPSFSSVHSIGFPASCTVLDWWLEPFQQQTYPWLYRMAVDILTAPGMNAEAERVFSRPRRTITFYREKLKAESVSKKECL
jgi:hypothetical protein